MGVVIAAGANSAQQTGAAEDPPAWQGPFRISLPTGIDPANVMINFGLRVGTGQQGGVLQTRQGVHDYAIQLDAGSGAPTALRLALYVPGYRMVTATFTRADVQASGPFIPQLVPLPTTRLEGRMVDSAGQPLKGESLRIDYLLVEVMDYHGYADGMVPTLHIADIRTNDSGVFAVDVPALIEDPFFRDTRSPGHFQLRSGTNLRNPDAALEPGVIPVQAAYEQQTIRKSGFGTLHGKLGRQFLLQNRLAALQDMQINATPSGAASQPVAQIGTATRGPIHAMTYYSARIGADGSFDLRVPAGKYDIALVVLANGRTLPMERDVVIEESGRTLMERP